MKIDGIRLVEGSNITNMVVASGAEFPSNPNEGEAFYATGTGTPTEGFYIYNGGAWKRLLNEDDTVATGDIIGGGTGTIVYQSAADTTAFLTLGTTGYVLIAGASAPQYAAQSTLAAGTAAALATTRSISITGDASWTVNFDGSTNATAGLTLSSTSVSANSYGSATQVATFTVDAKGRLTAAGNTTVTPAWASITSTPTTLSGYGITDAQSTDADLTALAGLSTTGIVIRTGSGTATTRSVAVSGTGLSVTNADGVSGDPTITSNATSSNTVSTIVARDASGNFTAGTITAALSGNASTASALATTRSISITGDASWTVNFDGSANATAGLTLATVNSSPATAAFHKITTNAKGLVTASTAVGSSDITTALGYTPVNKAGDTMTGSLTLSGAPTVSLHAATKQYVDDVASGMNVHLAVRAATGTALTATYSNGTGGVGATLTGTGALPTIGGVTLVDTDRVLVKDQGTTYENGIYVVTQAASNWQLTRATDFDNSPASEIVSGDSTYVQEGTYAGTQWVQTTAGTITVGTTAIVFTQFGGPGTYSAGTGIQISSNVISNIGVTSIAGTTDQITASASTGAVTLSLPSSVTIGGTMTAGTFSGALSGNASSATNATNVGITDDTTTAATMYPTWVTAATGNLPLYVSSSKMSFVPSTGILSSAAYAATTDTSGYVLGTSASPTGRMYINGGAVKIEAYSSNAFGVAVNSAVRMSINTTGEMTVGTGGNAGYTMSVNRNPTGATTSGSIILNGTVQSDVTSTYYGYRANLNTQATSFTLGTAVLFGATSGSIGAGSAVTNLYGFHAASTLSSLATNVFAIRSDVAAATNMWNLYISGTAQNYIAGNVGIGSNSFSGYTLRVNKTLDSNLHKGVSSEGQVTTGGSTIDYFYTNSSQAAAVSTTLLSHYRATQGTYTSAPTSQAGFNADSTLTGATNNYGFRGQIASSTGRYNLYMDGTAANYLAGSLGVGTTNPLVAVQIGGDSTYRELRMMRSGDTTTAQAIVFGKSRGTESAQTIVASGDTLGTILWNGNDGSGSTAGAIKTGAQIQAVVDSTPSTGIIPGRLVFNTTDSAGTSTERMRINSTGKVGIGAASQADTNLLLGTNITGATTAYATRSNGVIQSDVTSAGVYNRTTASTAAASFTLASLIHYQAVQGSIGAGSAVTNQTGFAVDSSMVGASFNIGFRGQIAAASQRWNTYMDGTAQNWFAGNVGIGSGKSAPSTELDVNGTVTATTFSGSGASLTTLNASNLSSGTVATARLGSGTADSTVFLRGDNTWSAVDLSTKADKNNPVFTGTSMTLPNAMAITGDFSTSANIPYFKSNTGTLTSLRIYGPSTAANATGNLTAYSTSDGPAGDSRTINMWARNSSTLPYVIGMGKYTTGTAADATESLSFIGNVTNTVWATINPSGPTVSTDLTTKTYVDTALTTLNASNLTSGTVASARLNISTTTTDTTVGRIFRTGDWGVGSTAVNLADFTATEANYARFFRALNTATGGPGVAISGVALPYDGTPVTSYIGVTAGSAGNHRVWAGSKSSASATPTWSEMARLTAPTFTSYIGLGGINPNYLISVSGSQTGAVTTGGINIAPTIQSDVTTTAYGVLANPTTAASAFTLTNFTGFQSGISLGAGSTVTNAFGFRASSLLGTNATNSYGFYGDVAAASGKWNAYMAGTAQNYFAGNVGIGSGKTAPAQALDVTGNIAATGNVLRSVATGISAAGSTQGTATAITKDMNVVSTVAASTGVVLPTAVAGMQIVVINTGANALSVYPATGGTIDSNAANAALSLPVGSRIMFMAVTTTQWYTLNATYA